MGCIQHFTICLYDIYLLSALPHAYLESQKQGEHTTQPFQAPTLRRELSSNDPTTNPPTDSDLPILGFLCEESSQILSGVRSLSI